VISTDNIIKVGRDLLFFKTWAQYNIKYTFT
jgi:hypothetical protein